MLEIRHINKSFGTKQVLSGISLSLEPGIYGLLGPNGAGKSTLMNILTDNLHPDTGDVLWKGKSIFRNNRDYRRILGYAPQQQGLYDSFTGRRFLSYMGALKEIKKAEAEEEIERVAALVNLTTWLDDKIKSYSGGMKQRLLVAQSLLGQPELIILDEPTAGLDPKERVRVRETLHSLAEDKIILVATHVVSDVESIARKIIILQSGQIVAVGQPEELVENYAPGETLEEVYMKLFGEVPEDEPFDNRSKMTQKVTGA